LIDAAASRIHPDPARLHFRRTGSNSTSPFRSIALGCRPSTASSDPSTVDDHKLAKQQPASEGTHHALSASMYDADALEAINAEQLVTPTDRLLLRGGQLSRRRRPARVFATGSQPHIVIGNVQGCGESIARSGQGSRPDIAIARFGQGTQPDIAIARFAQGEPDVAIARFGQGEPDVAVTRLASGAHPAPARAAQPYLEYVAQPRVRGPQPEQHIAVADDAPRPRPARRHGRHERTAIIRRTGATGVQMFAMTVVIPALVGIVVGLAALI
jgi:hypothetical protein